LKFKLRRPVGKSEEAWILWSEQHPELKGFAERWASQTEDRMTTKAPSVVWLFQDALEAAGRGGISDDDMNKVVQALADSWRYGRTLRKWWTLHHKDLIDRD
jgi:hypothetical protein